MQTLQKTIGWLGMAMCLGIAMPVFAESAPVYDADSMQQQVDNSSSDQAQDLPPPPPPEQDSGYVPQQQASAAQAQAPAAPTIPLSMEQRMHRVEQQINNMQSSDDAARTESLQ